jgi:SAM-dependent methyltransferase
MWKPLDNFLKSFAEDIRQSLRKEYTVMPRFMYHQPSDYSLVSLPLKQIQAHRQSPRVPEPELRFGYSPEDEMQYLEWGKYDYEMLMNLISEYCQLDKKSAILDFGCSSGRVLRHFEKIATTNDWSLFGCDIQNAAIESMRADNWPQNFNIFTSTAIPHLPLEDSSIDFIYSFSVFTHTKYLWDSWLLELKRILKPGGIMMHTVHLEDAWEFYYKNRSQKWVTDNHTPDVYLKPRMDVDYLMYGDATTSQVFWRKEVLVNYWSRYLELIDVLPPTEEYSFQNRVVLRKPLR